MMVSDQHKNVALCGFFSCVRSLIADAEVMYVVSEIIAELPGLQDHQFSVWINHTALLSSILTHCSIPEEKHAEALTLLYKMVVSNWFCAISAVTPGSVLV